MPILLNLLERGVDVVPHFVAHLQLELTLCGQGILSERLKVLLKAQQCLLGVHGVQADVPLDFLLLHPQLTILYLQSLPQLAWEVVQIEELIQIFLSCEDSELVQELLLSSDVAYESDHVLEEVFILQLMHVVDLLDGLVNIVVYCVDSVPAILILLRLLIVQLLEFFKQMFLEALDKAPDTNFSLLFEFAAIESNKSEVVEILNIELHLPVSIL